MPKMPKPRFRRSQSPRGLYDLCRAHEAGQRSKRVAELAYTEALVLFTRNLNALWRSLRGTASFAKHRH